MKNMKKSYGVSKEIGSPVSSSQILELNYDDYDFEINPINSTLFQQGKDKDFKKAITHIERLVRNSLEYKIYRKYLTEQLNLKTCSFFGNIDKSDKSFNRVSIEMHHYPFTLYDVTFACLTKLFKDGKKYNEFIVSDEVLRLHYQLKIGIVPLSKTAHELHHNGELFISLNQVTGDYEWFHENYKDFLPLESLNYYNDLERLSVIAEKNKDKIPEVLQLNRIIIKNENQDSLITKEGLLLKLENQGNIMLEGENDD